MWLSQIFVDFWLIIENVWLWHFLTAAIVRFWSTINWIHYSLSLANLSHYLSPLSLSLLSTVFSSFSLSFPLSFSLALYPFLTERKETVIINNIKWCCNPERREKVIANLLMVVSTDILYYRQTVSSVHSYAPPEGERSHKRREASEPKMNFGIWTTLVNMIRAFITSNTLYRE
jgi:hypothetical protein